MRHVPADDERERVARIWKAKERGDTHYLILRPGRSRPPRAGGNPSRTAASLRSDRTPPAPARCERHHGSLHGGKVAGLDRRRTRHARGYERSFGTTKTTAFAQGPSAHSGISVTAKTSRSCFHSWTTDRNEFEVRRRSSSGRLVPESARSSSGSPEKASPVAVRVVLAPRGLRQGHRKPHRQRPG